MKTMMSGFVKGIKGDAMKKILIVVAALSVTLCATAAKLESFYGVKFGMRVSDGKFKIIEGLYTFVPEGESAKADVLYSVNVTASEKKVKSIQMCRSVPIAESHDVIVKYVKELKAKYGNVWSEVPKAEVQALFEMRSECQNIKRSEYAVRVFRNDAGEVCQILEIWLVRENTSGTVFVSCFDKDVKDTTAKDKHHKLESLYGVKFGMSISDGKFKELDDNWYVFVPEGESKKAEVTYDVIVTPSSKKIHTIGLTSHFIPVLEAHDMFVKYMRELETKYGNVWTEAPRELAQKLYECNSAKRNINRSEFVVRLFKNDAGVPCQIFMIWLTRINAEGAVAIQCIDTDVLNSDAKDQTQTKQTQKDNSDQKKPGVLTGADLVKGHFAKENGYSSTQLYKLSKKLEGQRLTFENGTVSNISPAPFDDDSLMLSVSFDDPSNVRHRFPFLVMAALTRSMSKAVLELDDGGKIKSLTGTVSSKVTLPGIFYIDNATFVADE